MRAEADLFTNDTIYIIFPKEIMVPMNPVCSGDVVGKCFSPKEGTLFVSLRLAKGVIPFNTTFTFKVSQVRNSISSRPTGPINLMGIEQGRNG